MQTLIWWTLALLVPLELFAAGNPVGGVLYGTGSVYLNGAQLANSMPLMSGDVIQTKEGIAHFDMVGSTAIIHPNAIVRFHASAVSLDRGSISMATGKSLTVSARDFQVTPVSTTWTQFEVTRSGGKIQIIARKNAVTIKCGAGVPTVIREGQQLIRADAQDCGLAHGENAGAPTAAKGPILDSPWAQGAGAATAGVLLWQTLSHGDDPVSPTQP